MERSESIVNLSKAMLVAQKEIEGATKDSKNPFFRSNYAGLPEVIAACKFQLNNAGIVVSQWLDSDGVNDYLYSMFVHADSGEYMSSKMKIHNTAEGIQQAMSEQTYLRRYMLQASSFMPSLDDDGEAAVGRKSEPAPKVEKKATKLEVTSSTVIESAANKAEVTAPAAIPTFSKKAVASVKASAEPKSEPKKSSAFDD